MKFLVGASIRVASGCLVGLTGAVARLTDGNHDCVLTIDGWLDGVFLAISGDALEWNVNEHDRDEGNRVGNG